MDTDAPDYPQGTYQRRGRSPMAGASRLLGRLADGAGHAAAVAYMVLTCSIILGIALRLFDIDNSWTYDVDLFALIWLAFLGAAFTSLRDHHVTAGIALENMFGGRGLVLSIIRYLIVAAFLVLFTVSGYQQALGSFVNHETTLDVMGWPVWIADSALPVGTFLWLVAETYKLLRRFAGGH